MLDKWLAVDQAVRKAAGPKHRQNTRSGAAVREVFLQSDPLFGWWNLLCGVRCLERHGPLRPVLSSIYYEIRWGYHSVMDLLTDQSVKLLVSRNTEPVACKRSQDAAVAHVDSELLELGRKIAGISA